MTRLTIGSAVVLILTGLGVLFALQRHSLNRIRQENAAMSRQAEELRLRARETASPPADDIPQREDAKAELLLLRERAERLQEENAALKREGAQLPSASPAPRKSFGFSEEELKFDLLKQSWTDSGYATPRDALLSTLRAQCSGDLAALSNSFTADAQTALLGKWSEQKPAHEIAAELIAAMDQLAGFRLLEKPAGTADGTRVDVFVEFIWQNGARSQHVVVMERSFNLEDWKVSNAGTFFGAQRR